MKRSLRWLGHVQSLPNKRIPKAALRRTPTGDEKEGQAKNQPEKESEWWNCNEKSETTVSFL